MLGFNSYNLLNTNNMFGMSNMYGMDTMFSMGNLFGNCGFGGSIFGGYGFSPFMDCNGYTNYNAMAGYSIGNTLINFAGLALNSCLGSGSSQAQAASDLNTDLDSCLEDIEEILEELGLESSSDTITTASLDIMKTDEVIEAERALEEATSEVSEKQNAYDTAASKLNSVTEPVATDERYKNADDIYNNTLYDSDLEQYNDLKKAVDDANTALKAAQDTKTTAEAKVEEAREAQKELIEELKELIKERDEIKREINGQILDDADGSKARHRNTELNINNFTSTDGSSRTITNVTRKDIAQLIYLFRTGTNDDKQKCKTAMENIDKRAFDQVASNDQANARKIILDWSAQNSNV